MRSRSFRNTDGRLQIVLGISIGVEMWTYSWSSLNTKAIRRVSFMTVVMDEEGKAYHAVEAKFNPSFSKLETRRR